MVTQQAPVKQPSVDQVKLLSAIRRIKTKGYVNLSSSTSCCFGLVSFFANIYVFNLHFIKQEADCTQNCLFYLQIHSEL